MPVFRHQDVQSLADQVETDHALELIAAESPVVRSAVVRIREDRADVAIAEFTGHAAVVVEKMAHRLASIPTVGVGVRDWPRHQEPFEEVGLPPLVELPLSLHDNGLKELSGFSFSFVFRLRLRRARQRMTRFTKTSPYIPILCVWLKPWWWYKRSKSPGRHLPL